MNENKIISMKKVSFYIKDIGQYKNFKKIIYNNDLTISKWLREKIKIEIEKTERGCL